MASKFAFLPPEPPLTIDTHLCDVCVSKHIDCEDVHAVYGTRGRAGRPNICACSAYEPLMVSRGSITSDRVNNEPCLRDVKSPLTK